MERKKKGHVKVIDTDVDFRKMKSVHSINGFFAIFGILFITFFGYLSKYQMYSLPDYKTNQDAKTSPESFIGERAWHDLKILTNFGPKVTGTYANEQLAVDFLKREVNYIKQLCHKNQEIELDHHITSGDYFITMVHQSYSNLYRNVQNIVVKLHGESDEHSIMLNCHFDSVASSPGANDDGANCAIMMEILRVLSKQEKRSRYSIIFLFNGAEEMGLRASHGFITKHKWSKQIRAFINLEACGSGGKEMLFQTGPKHSWLVEAYKQAAVYPNAHVAAEEIFQSNVIPSDTDFRIFRDFGEIPGMDFAHIKDGFRYHTKYDDIDFIQPGALQRTGDNILNLVKLISNSEKLANTQKYAGESAVFFDFLGLFFISYPKDVGAFINLLVVLSAIIFPFLSLSKATINTHTKRILSETVLSFISTILGTGFSGFVCFLLAYQLDAMDHSMTWYSSTFLVHGLYSTTSLLAQVSVYNLVDYIFGKQRTPISLGLKVQSRLNGVNLFWGVLTLGLTFLGYRVGYVLMIILLISLISNICIFILGLHNSVHKWIYFYLFGQIFIILFTSQLYHNILDVFIPISGRMGSKTNPDIMIGVISSFMSVLMCSYFIPLIQLLRRQVTLYLTLISIFLISIFFAIATHAGFPYRGNENEYPTVQRHYIFHVLRNFHDLNGGIGYTDSGFWLLDWDRNAKKTIEGITMPELPTPQNEIKMADTSPLLGLPAGLPHQVTIYGGYWLNAPKPKVNDMSIISLTSRNKIDDHLTELSFTIYGNSMCSLYLRPKQNVRLHAWSLEQEVYESSFDDGCYFLEFIQGLEDTQPWVFNVTLKTENGYNVENGLVDIVANTLHWESHKDHTEMFKKFLNRVPKWAHVVPAIAALNAYIF